MHRLAVGGAERSVQPRDLAGWSAVAASGCPELGSSRAGLLIGAQPLGRRLRVARDVPLLLLLLESQRRRGVARLVREGQAVERLDLVLEACHVGEILLRRVQVRRLLARLLLLFLRFGRGSRRDSTAAVSRASPALQLSRLEAVGRIADLLGRWQGLPERCCRV